MYLGNSKELVKLLDLEEICGDEVQEGDIIYAHNIVVIATKIERLAEGTPIDVISFGGGEGAPRDPGYVRSGISVRPKEYVKRIPKSWIIVS